MPSSSCHPPCAGPTSEPGKAALAAATRSVPGVGGLPVRQAAPFVKESWLTSRIERAAHSVMVGRERKLQFARVVEGL